MDRERRLRHLPVIDGSEVLSAWLSSGDLMRWFSINQEQYILTG
jgi:hypothetical protein